MSVEQTAKIVAAVVPGLLAFGGVVFHVMHALPSGEVEYSNLGGAEGARAALRRGDLGAVADWLRDARTAPDPHNEVAARVRAAACWDRDGKASEALAAQHGQSAPVAAVRGTRMVRAAWQARGGGKGSEVTPERAERFAELLLEARAVIDAALASHPRDPLLHAVRIETLLGLGEDEAPEAIEAAFRAAVDACPSHWLAHHLRLLSLSPKWHGEGDDMERFAESALARLPPASPLRSLALHAAFERHLYIWQWHKDKAAKRAYLRDAARRQQMRDTFDAMCASPETRAHPCFPVTLMLFAWWGDEAEDKRLLVDALQALGPCTARERWLLWVDTAYIAGLRKQRRMFPLRFAKRRD